MSSRSTSLEPPLNEAATGHSKRFTGRINRRLTFVFGSFFLIVLVGTGVSSFLAISLLYRSRQTGKESEQVELVESVHTTLHHFFSAMQRARLGGSGLPNSLRESYLNTLRVLVADYDQAGGGQQNVEKLRQVIADVEDLSQRIVGQKALGSAGLSKVLSREDLNLLASTELRVQTFAHMLGAELETNEKRDVVEAERNMRITAAFNLVFMVASAIFMLGSSTYFYRNIAVPLRRLADAATEIGDWNAPKEIPVTSNDEIGALTHTLNAMAKKLRKHEERFKEMATLEERERIAQELHDSIAQDLGLVHLKLAEVEKNMSLTGITAAKEDVTSIRRIVKNSYVDVREAIFGLRAMVSESVQFVPALTEYLRDFGETRNIPIELKIADSDLAGVSNLAEIQLIRIIQEALNNTFKHAQATAGKITFEPDANFLKISIEDNGKGFIPDEIAQKKLHFGLQTMQERAKGLGGTLIVESAPGQGTKVIVHLPNEARP